MTDDGKRNRAIVDLLEPGSTAKTFTITAALESGLFTPQSVIDTSPGYIRIDGSPIEDPINYGPATLERILYKSSQVGASKVALAMGEEPMLDVLARVGFGESPGTGFPGETTGVLPNRSRWSKSEIATLGYGYGFQVTPLQLAAAYMTYANRGVRKPVSLLKTEGPVAGTRVIDAALADTVVDMLRSVVSKELGGTGVRAAIPSHDVAGKTGTTWYYDVARGGYTLPVSCRSMNQGWSSWYPFSSHRAKKPAVGKWLHRFLRKLQREPCACSTLRRASRSLHAH
jgi:cell division protein FtsI (penicillin-binding protein 3)